MVHPQIYLAQTPATAHARRMLRIRALDLSARLGQIADDGPCSVVLNLAAATHETADLLVLRPASAIVGLIKDIDGPLDIQSNGQWTIRATGASVYGTQGRTPIAQLRRVRAAICRQLDVADRALAAQLGTLIGALIVAPATHPATSATLDVEDHRQRIKLLGLDELAPLASMLRAGASLDEAAMHTIAAIFDARRWHDGTRLLFEIGLAPFQLRLLPRNDRPARSLALLEGASIIGRRTAALQYEYRQTIDDDDTISADHAAIICATDGQVTLRDTSTNGSYIIVDGGEQRVHRAQQLIVPGDVIRLGETELRLEARER